MRVILITAILAVILTGCGGKTPREKCNDSTTAYVMSQTFVKQRLNAPSTASFPYISSEGVSVRHAGQCTHDIRAYVDAKNGFGGTVRTRYYARVRNEIGTDNWELLDFKFTQ